MRFLVYGATKGRGDGIGREASIELRRRGHDVLGLCRNPDKAAAESQFPLEALEIDAKEGQERLKAVVREREPDVIWSACGVGFSTPAWAMPDEELDAMVEANVRNNILFCRATAPSCVDGGPHLILTGSSAGVLDSQGAAVYAGVKGFLVPFLRGQRAEYRRQGHNPKLSLLLLGSVRATGLELVVDALEFVGRQAHSLEILVA